MNNKITIRYQDFPYQANYIIRKGESYYLREHELEEALERGRAQCVS